MTQKLRLGILGSTRGTVMLSLIQTIKEHTLNAEIAVVVSNKPHALILDRANTKNIPNFFVSSKDLTREQYDEKISAIFKKHNVHMIALIGYMRILSKQFVDEWRNKLINIHQAFLTSQLSETGCTVHYVTENLDAGEIILQKKCSVLANDDVQTLKTRVQSLEAYALIEVIQSHIISINHKC